MPGVSEEKKQMPGDNEVKKPMKIGFAIKAKIKKKVAIQEKKEEVVRIAVTSLSGTQSLKKIQHQDDTKALVIPLMKKNNWEKRSFTPSVFRDEEKKKEVDQEKKEGTKENSKPKTLDEQAAEELLNGPKAEDSDEETKAMPILIQNAVPGLLEIKDDRHRLQHDMDYRPVSITPDSDAYERVPISQFGAAMLRGMGWSKGKPVGVGRFARVVEAKSLAPRAKNLGLGASPLAELSKQAVIDANKKKVRRAPEPQKKKKKKRRSSSERDRERPHKKKKRARPITWVCEGIRVRIRSKTISNGKYLGKKGRVLDVTSPTTFTIILDGDKAKYIEEVQERDVDTALPKKGGRVMVVLGQHKGQTGRLLERDRKRQLAVVQFDAEQNVAKVEFDKLSEFVR